jgi:hypothetical protein
MPQEQGDPVITPGTGFPFRRLLRLAGLWRRYSTLPPHGNLQETTENIYIFFFSNIYYRTKSTDSTLNGRYQLKNMHGRQYCIFDDRKINSTKVELSIMSYVQNMKILTLLQNLLQDRNTKQQKVCC